MAWRKIISQTTTYKKCNILRNESELKLIEINRQHLSELKWSQIGLTMLNKCIANAKQNNKKRRRGAAIYRFMEINRLIQDLLHNFHNLASSSGIRHDGHQWQRLLLRQWQCKTRIIHSMHFDAQRCQLNFVRMKHAYSLYFWLYSNGSR